MYIDTHCHLHDSVFTDMDAICKEYTFANVCVAIDMACNLDCAVIGKNLSEQYESIYFGVGFHPSDANAFDESLIAQMEQLASHPKCVAIGEIGLDFYWEGYDKAKQINTFERQIQLANNVKLPMSIHMREATKDTIDILKANKNNLVSGGVIHCFAGSVETAKILLDLGLYISFGGTVTFKNANKILDVAKYVPQDRILSETDSPFLAPHPYRGSVNNPKNIPIIVNKLAELRGVENVQLANQIKNNAKRLFYKLKAI